MKFWQAFSKKEVLKQLFFVLALFAILIPVAIWDSDTQVKISFTDTVIKAKSDKFSISVLYDDIAQAELVPMADPGEKGEDGFDNDILRCGYWSNEEWGDYAICADCDTSVCIVMRLHDGRVMVFSQKDDATTTEKYNTLLTHLK